MFDLKVGDKVKLTAEAQVHLLSLETVSTATIQNIELRPPSKPLLVLSKALTVTMENSPRFIIDSAWVEKIEKILDMSQIN